MMQVTEEQKAYIKEHINDRPRNRVAAKIGVPYNTFLFYVHKYGGACIRRGPHKDKWQIVAENYGSMPGHEIDRKFGFSKGYSNYVARKILNIEHGEEAKRKIQQRHAENINKAREKHGKDYLHKRWKLSRRMDEIRIMSGLPQKKKFKFKELPSRAYRARYRLLNVYHYIKSTDPYTLLYDSNTQRRPLTGGFNMGGEDYYIKAYGFKFVEDVEDEETDDNQ